MEPFRFWNRLGGTLEASVFVVSIGEQLMPQGSVTSDSDPIRHSSGGLVHRSPGDPVGGNQRRETGLRRAVQCPAGC
jgi:hypothetical protein